MSTSCWVYVLVWVVTWTGGGGIFGVGALNPEKAPPVVTTFRRGDPRRAVVRGAATGAVYRSSSALSGMVGSFSAGAGLHQQKNGFSEIFIGFELHISPVCRGVFGFHK